MNARFAIEKTSQPGIYFVYDGNRKLGELQILDRGIQAIATPTPWGKVPREPAFETDSEALAWLEGFYAGR